MRRLLFAVPAALLLAACASPTAPAPRQLSPSAASRDDNPFEEPVPDPNCRSGWSVANGRCI